MPKAVVLTEYGPPDVLVWRDVSMPYPGPDQVRVRVKAAGVSASDPKIRAGDAQAAFRLPPDAILGFEIAGVVELLGRDVSGVAEGDEVACLLLTLGGYAEYVLASTWTPKPRNVSWSDAAALPASAEPALGALKQLGVSQGETLLILGAAGSVGMIATQLAVARGARVVGAAAPRDHDVISGLGAVPVAYGPGLADRVRDSVASVDAVLDAAGKGGLSDAVSLAGARTRVIPLADTNAADLGVAFSVGTPDRAPEALDETMTLLAAGALRLRRHRLLEKDQTHEKFILDAP